MTENQGYSTRKIDQEIPHFSEEKLADMNQVNIQKSYSDNVTNPINLLIEINAEDLKAFDQKGGKVEEEEDEDFDNEEEFADDMEEWMQEEDIAIAAYQEEITDEETDEEEDIEAIPIIEFGAMAPRADEIMTATKKKARDDRTQLYDLNEEEIASELKRSINQVYRNQLTSEGKEHVLERFIELQKQALQLWLASPDLPTQSMVRDYFQLNFSKDWLVPIVMDWKQVYVPDSEFSFGPRINYQGGQSKILEKIDKIIKLRNDENLGLPHNELIETSNKLSQIQFNYRPDKSIFGLQGQTQASARFNSHYHRTQEVLRFHPDLDAIAIQPDECKGKTLEEIVEMQETGELNKWHRILNFRQSNNSWLRHLNVHQKQEEVVKDDAGESKSINRIIIGQKVDTAVPAEEVNLVGFIRKPLLGETQTPYQIFVRENPDVKKPYIHFQKLSVDQLKEYKQKSIQYRRNQEEKLKIYQFNCIPEFTGDYLQEFPDHTVIYLFPRDEVKYENLEVLTERLRGVVKQSGQFSMLLRSQAIKLLDLTTPEDLYNLLDKHKLDFRLEGEALDNFIADFFQHLEKIQNYLTFLKQIIPDSGHIIDIQLGHLPNTTSIYSLQTLFAKFGMGLEDLSEEDKIKLQKTFTKNMRNIDFYRRKRTQLKKIFKQINKIYYDGEERSHAIPAKILKNPELVPYYGKYPYRGHLKDTDLTRVTWIVSQVDNGALYFALFHYQSLLELIVRMNLGVKVGVLSTFTVVEQNILEALGEAGTRLTVDQWAGHDAVIQFIDKLLEQENELVAASEQAEDVPWPPDVDCGKYSSVRGQLGIQLRTTADDKIIVSEVYPNSLSIILSMKQGNTFLDTNFHIGDELSAIDGRKIGSDGLDLAAVETLISTLPPGQKIQVSIYRDGFENPTFVTTNPSYIRWDVEDDEYNLNKICIWSGDQFVPRNIYFSMRDKMGIAQELSRVRWDLERVRELPKLLRDSYSQVEQAQARFKILKEISYSPWGSYGLYRFDMPSLTKSELVPEAYNPVVVALRQLESIPNSAERDRRILEVLDKRTELVIVEEGRFLRSTETGQYVACVHKRDQLRMGFEEFLEEYSVNGTYCKYCMDQINIEEYDPFEGFDDADQPIRREGTIMTQPGSPSLRTCQEAFVALGNYEEWDWVLEQVQDREETFPEFEDEINPDTHPNVTEFQQWICYILDNMVDNGLYYIRHVLELIIHNFIKSIRTQSLIYLSDSRIEISDPRVTDRFNEFLNNVEKMPKNIKTYIEKRFRAEGTIASNRKKIGEMEASAERDKLTTMVKKQETALTKMDTDFKKLIVIPILKAQVFVDRYVHLLSQVVLQVSTKYPEVMNTILERVRQITEKLVPTWIQEYEYKVGRTSVQYIVAPKTFYKTLWDQILYFNQQGVGITLQRHFNNRFKDEQEVIFEQNRELLKKIQDRWMESLHVLDEPYKEEFFLTENVLNESASNLSEIDLQLKYVAQQIHKNLVQLSSKLNNPLEDMKLDGTETLVHGESDPGCFSDVREYWSNVLWNYFLKGVGSDIVASDNRIWNIANQPELINLGETLQSLQARRSDLHEQRQNLLYLGASSYGVHWEPHPYILNKTRLSLQPNAEASATQVPINRFQFSDSFLTKLENLRHMAELHIDKRRNNLACYLSGYEWGMLPEGDKTAKKFTEILTRVKRELLALGQINPVREREIREQVQKTSPEATVDQLLEHVRWQIAVQEINVMKKYLISYFRYFIARFSFTNPFDVIEAPEVKPFFEKNTKSTFEVDPPEMYQSEIFQKIVNESQWLTNDEIEKIVSYARDSVCYPAYEFQLSPEDAKNIIYYVTYLDLSQAIKNLGEGFLTLTTTTVENYEANDPMINLNSASQINTFIQSQLVYTPEKQPLILTDLINRVKQMVEKNRGYIYLTKKELQDLHNRRMASSKRKIKRTEMTREWTRLRLPWLGEEEEIVEEQVDYEPPGAEGLETTTLTDPEWGNYEGSAEDEVHGPDRN